MSKRYPRVETRGLALEQKAGLILSILWFSKEKIESDQSRVNRPICVSFDTLFSEGCSVLYSI